MNGGGFSLNHYEVKNLARVLVDEFGMPRPDVSAIRNDDGDVQFYPSRLLIESQVGPVYFDCGDATFSIMRSDDIVDILKCAIWRVVREHINDPASDVNIAVHAFAGHSMSVDMQSAALDGDDAQVNVFNRFEQALDARLGNPSVVDRVAASVLGGGYGGVDILGGYVVFLTEPNLELGRVEMGFADGSVLSCGCDHGNKRDGIVETGLSEGDEKTEPLRVAFADVLTDKDVLDKIERMSHVGLGQFGLSLLASESAAFAAHLHLDQPDTYMFVGWDSKDDYVVASVSPTGDHAVILDGLDVSASELAEALADANSGVCKFDFTADDAYEMLPSSIQNQLKKMTLRLIQASSDSLEDCFFAEAARIISDEIAMRVVGFSSIRVSPSNREVRDAIAKAGIKVRVDSALAEQAARSVLRGVAAMTGDSAIRGTCGAISLRDMVAKAKEQSEQCEDVNPFIGCPIVVYVTRDGKHPCAKSGIGESDIAAFSPFDPDALELLRIGNSTAADWHVFRIDGFCEETGLDSGMTAEDVVEALAGDGMAFDWVEANWPSEDGRDVDDLLRKFNIRADVEGLLTQFAPLCDEGYDKFPRVLRLVSRENRLSSSCERAVGVVREYDKRHKRQREAAAAEIERILERVTSPNGAENDVDEESLTEQQHVVGVDSNANYVLTADAARSILSGFPFYSSGLDADVNEQREILYEALNFSDVDGGGVIALVQNQA